MHDALQNLVNLAHADGGWGYVGGEPAHLEPTCVALLALKPHSDRFATAVDAGRDFLRRCRQSDGSYRLAQGREAAVWGTAMALFVETICRQGDTLTSEQVASAQFLLGLEGRVIKADPEVADMVDIDMELVGWPWAEGTFSWVEPTAWACIALVAVGQGSHPRVQEGRKLLLDRAFPEGGINYGNRMILGRMTEPIPGPTALMLIALWSEFRNARIQGAIRYLCGQLLESNDLEHLGWGRIALENFHESPDVAKALPAIDGRIRQSVNDRPAIPWLQPSPLREALAALALSAGEWNPFVSAPSNRRP